MNRTLLFSTILVLLFAIGVIGWFFMYADKKTAPTFKEEINPLSLKTFPKGFLFFGDNKEEPPTSTLTTEMTFAKPEVLTKIWERPATGQTFVDMQNIIEIDATSTVGTTTINIKKLSYATSTLLLFVDRPTGYVYAYNRELLKIYQISNTTIPGIYDAYIFNNGENIVLRYENTENHTIVGILAKIPKVKENEQAKPLENIQNLPQEVTSVAVNKNKTLLSYLVTGGENASIYTISSKGVALIGTSPFKEWALSYGGDILYATSKPSAYVEGQTVKIPSFETVLGNRTGLMSLVSPTGIFLNSMWSSDGLKTFLSKNSNQLVLSIRTIANKCSWGDNEYLICAVPKLLPKKTEGLPDDWFQGRYFFEDDIVTVNAITSEITPLYSFNQENKEIFDVTKITTSKNNTFISFIRKQDASLWLLDASLISR